MSDRKETLEEIDSQCARLSDTRTQMSLLADKINLRARESVGDMIKEFQSLASTQANQREALAASIEANEGYFEKPRTLVMHGVKCGFRKLPGQLVGDEAKIIRNINKKLSAEAGALMTTRTTLNKAALKKLDAATLSSIGASITEVDDEVIVSAAQTDTDKLLAAIIMHTPGSKDSQDE